MTVESSKEADPRINFLLRSFTDNVESAEDQAPTREAEGMQPVLIPPTAQ